MSRARRRTSPWSLQVSFLAVAALMLLGAAAAAIAADVQTNARVRQQALAEDRFAAGKAAGQLGDSVAFWQKALHATVGAPTFDQTFSDPSHCLLGFGPIAPFESGHIDLINRDGTVACSSGALNGVSYAGASWLQSSGPQVISPVADAVTSHPDVLIVDSTPGGIAAVFLDLTPVGAKLASEFGSGDFDLEFLLLNQTANAILTRSIGGQRWAGKSLKGTAFQAAADGRDVDGHGRFYTMGRVAGLGWEVYVGAASARALADAYPSILVSWGIIGSGALISLLALVFVYITVSRLIVRRQEAENSYHLLFDESPLPKWVYDSRTLGLLEVNQAALERYGYDRAEFLSLTVPDLVAAEHLAEVRSFADSHGSVARLGPIFHVGKGGRAFEVRITAHPLLFQGRDARYVTIETVTDQEKLERQLRLSQRLESLGQLAGGVAHDFNNLLGVILNFATFAKEQVAKAAQGRGGERWGQVVSDLEQVERAAERGAQLTRQLLIFARREVVQAQVIDVNEVIRQLKPLLQRALGEHIELSLDLESDLWSILMDPGQFEQILVNLAVNARDAMPGGGTLTIDSANQEVDETYAASRPGVPLGRYVRLRVSDTGAGMDEDTLQRAFEPFFTTKPRGEGTGLGLATVYGLVTGAGGRPALYSEPGHGTTFTALFPATEVAVEAPATRERDGRGGYETILVVEDEDALREVTVRMLRRNGYEVFAAGDGPQALELLEQNKAEIDLLITDVVMPHMLGPEVAERVRAQRPRVRVLYISGYAQPVLGTTGTLEEGVVLLEKPFTEAVLLAQVREVLDAVLSGSS